MKVITSILGSGVFEEGLLEQGPLTLRDQDR